MDPHWISIRFSSRSSLQRRFRLRNTAKSPSWQLGATSSIFHRFLTSPRPFNLPAKRVFAKACRAISRISQEITENAAEPLNAHPNELLFSSNFMKSWFLSKKTSPTTIFNNSARLISPLFCPADGAVGGFRWNHTSFHETRSAPEIPLHSTLEFACFLSGPRNHVTSKNSPISRNWAKTPYTCHGISHRFSIKFQKNHDFNENSCSVETQIRLRDAPDANFTIFIEISFQKHRFDLVFRRGCWFSPFSIKKVLHFPRFFPFLRVLRKTTFRRAFNFPRLSSTFLTPSKMLL